MHTKSAAHSSILLKTMSDGQGASASPTRQTIERTFRERRRGFLAWALKHAPDPSTAEDILQDAFIRAVSNADALSPVEDLAAWIFTAMRNRLTDLFRSEGARRRAGQTSVAEELLAEVAADAGFDPQETALREELLSALEVAISALPAPQRDVIEAQALGETSFRELSDRTGVPIDTLMARKRYAVKKLAAALKYWMKD